MTSRPVLMSTSRARRARRSRRCRTRRSGCSAHRPSRLSPELDAALNVDRGCTPEVGLLHDDRATGPAWDLIAKLSVQSDPYPVVRAEADGHGSGSARGLDVAIDSADRFHRRRTHVLLVERFDRPLLDPEGGRVGRSMMVSALTMLELDEFEARVCHLSRSRRSDTRSVHERRRDAPRALRQDRLQRLHRQHRRPRSQSRCVLGRISAHADSRLRPVSATPERRDRGTSDGDRSGRQPGVTLRGVPPRRTCTTSVAPKPRRSSTIKSAVITDQWNEAADAARLTRAERDQLWGRQILNRAVHDPD